MSNSCEISAFAKIVTANHLLEGDVIYLAADQTWVRDLSVAKTFLGGDSANAALDSAIAKGDPIAAPYLADVVEYADGTIRALHFREVFRATGPSNRILGKQATKNARGQAIV